MPIAAYRRLGRVAPSDAPPRDNGGEGQEQAVKIPAGNATTAEWRAFTRAQTPPFDVESKSRDELRNWFHSVHGGGDKPPAPAPQPVDDAVDDGDEQDDGDVV